MVPIPQVPLSVSQRIIQLLQENPDHAFTIEKIAESIQHNNYNTVAITVYRLAFKQTIYQISRGYYAIHPR